MTYRRDSSRRQWRSHKDPWTRVPILALINSGICAKPFRNCSRGIGMACMNAPRTLRRSSFIVECRLFSQKYTAKMFSQKYSASPKPGYATASRDVNDRHKNDRFYVKTVCGPYVSKDVFKVSPQETIGLRTRYLAIIGRIFPAFEYSQRRWGLDPVARRGRLYSVVVENRGRE